MWWEKLSVWYMAFLLALVLMVLYGLIDSITRVAARAYFREKRAHLKEMLHLGTSNSTNEKE